MTAQELKKLIKESIREEIKDILKEAVEIASRPSLQQEHVRIPSPTSIVDTKPLDPITRILRETKAGMSREDYKQVMSLENKNTLSPTPAKPMLQTGTRPEDIGSVDLSTIPGIGKAAQILKEAEKKDKERHL